MDDISLKIAKECAKTQKKMRNQFIKDFMKQTNVEDLGEESIEMLRYVLTLAYDKGAIDTLSITATSQLATMEGGEDDEV